jgi:RNA polymerase sigma-70 factor, ECF subfamily
LPSAEHGPQLANNDHDEKKTLSSPRIRPAGASKGTDGRRGVISAQMSVLSPADLEGSVVAPEDPPSPRLAFDSVSDHDLVARACGGDRAAFEVLLRRHYDSVHRVAWRLTGSSADADDIAQDVCCVLVEKLGSFKGEARFTTWLYGVVVNTFRDHHRRSRTLKRFRASLAVLAGLASGPDGRDLYRRSWMACELSRLDPLLRETVVLVVGEDMSHGEAANALGVAESTVSWRMHEAKRRLSSRATKEVPGDL